MRNEENLELVEFLTSNQAPPEDLTILAQKDIEFSLRKTSILFKFISLQLVGALLTLTFCPQFGVGLPEGHGIIHALKMYGDWVCASFCGSLFFLSGSLMAFTAMNPDEFFWVWKRFKVKLVFVPTLFWAALMLFNLTWKLDSETLTYHAVWIVSAILTQELVLFLKSRKYRGELRKLA